MERLTATSEVMFFWDSPDEWFPFVNSEKNFTIYARSSSEKTIHTIIALVIFLSKWDFMKMEKKMAPG